MWDAVLNGSMMRRIMPEPSRSRVVGVESASSLVTLTFRDFRTDAFTFSSELISAWKSSVNGVRSSPERSTFSSSPCLVTTSVNSSTDKTSISDLK